MATSPLDFPNVPKEFCQAKPSPTSVKFAGHYLNLREISRHLDCDHGHLSRIFNSHRGPSVKMAIRLAVTLNMTVDEFLAALNARKFRTALH